MDERWTPPLYLRFVLNAESGILHRLPASEACNTDQIADKRRFVSEFALKERQLKYRRCKRCFRAD